MGIEVTTEDATLIISRLDSIEKLGNSNYNNLIKFADFIGELRDKIKDIEKRLKKIEKLEEKVKDMPKVSKPNYIRKREYIMKMCKAYKKLTTKQAVNLCIKNGFRGISKDCILNDFSWIEENFKHEYKLIEGKSGRYSGMWTSAVLVYKGSRVNIK